MQCAKCGSTLGKDWNYCPSCGSRRGGEAADPFAHVFREVEDAMRRMGVEMKVNMEVLDLSKEMEKAMKSMDRPSRGFSFRLRQKDNETPQISFKKFGQAAPAKVIVPRLRKPAEGKPKTHKIGIKLPGETAEPRASVSRQGNRVLVEIDLPGVKSHADIDVDELENSVEVKAVAGNMGYFKIIKKPEFSKIVKKNFENGKLHLELL